MKAFKKDGFTFVATPETTHKYQVFKDGNFITNFGGIRKTGKPYSQFKDKIGYYSKYNNNSEKKKKSYYARHGKAAKKHSSKWFSHKYLW